MRRSGKFSVSSLSFIFRIMVTAVFLFGLLPLPALAQNDGTLAGQVTDNATNPVAGATVLVFASGSPTPGWNASTNASGGYNVTVPEGNDYRLSAVKAGFITGHAPGQNVTANATTAVNFSLAPGGIIQGAVSDNASSPIQGASVRAFPAASPQNTYDSLPTDPSGQYSVTVPPGPGYTVVVNAPGFATANQTNITATQGSPVTVPFTLEPPPQAPPQDSTPPANVTDLAAVSTTYDSVTLAWTAPGDDASTGQAAQYEIRYAATSIGDATAWDNATPAQGVAPPQPAGSSENFTVSALTDNTTYFFAIKTRDDANLWSGLSNSATANTTAAPPTPFFNIAHSQNRFSFMLAAGDNITETFNVTSVNSFAGTVNLQFNGPPEIASSSVLFPTQVTLGAGQTQPVSLTLGASAMTPSGNYQVGIGGQTSAYGGQQRGFFFSVNVGVAGQALLSASPSMVAAGAPTNFFASQFTPGENVTLRWDSGPSVGVTLATGQIAGDGAWTAQVTIPADTPGGNFAVKAVSASNSAVFQLTITSGVDPDFAMSASPQFVSIPPGNSGQVTIYLTSINGFGAPVTLSANAPPGVTGNLSAASVTPGAGQTVSATLSITVADWASPDMFHINIEGSSADPAINRMTDVTLDIPPPAAWGPGLSLSQSYGQVGDTITLTGSNFPPATQGQTVTIKEVFTDATLPTSPQTITVNAGGFTGTVAIPQGIPSGNYRLRAVVPSTSDFAERDFQILGTGETYSLGVSPQSTTVTTEQGANSATVSVNIYSVGGSSPAINLAIEGAPSWLTYQFGSLPVNTPASGNNSVTVPAGGSASRNLSLTASLTAPSGNYAITVKGWVTGGAEQRVSLELTVQPPAGFGMAQITLSPNFGGNGQNVNFSGSGFTDSSPSQVTEIVFGQLDLITGQSLPTITVPTSGASAGKFSGSFRVPGILPPGSYPVKFRVGTSPNDKFVIKSFTITGPGDTFVLQASPSFLWAEQGHQVSTLVKVQAVGSSSPNVSLSLEGLPADISANFSSSNITAPPGGVISTDLNLSISDWLPAGHYTITIKGQRTGTAEVHRIPLEMDIVPPAGFGMASIYLNPTVGPLGTWITISGSGFPASTPLTHLYFGPPNSQNDRIASLPSISTDGNGALSAVLQVPPGLTAGNYPVEVVVGTYPDDRMANSDFTLVSDQASFNINLSPTFVQAAPGTSVSISVNMQSFGNSSANITLRVEGPPNIEWRFDSGGWQTATTLTPPIGGNIMSSLEIQPKASTPMGHYSLAVKATAGAQQEFRNLEIDVGASAGYGMPIFSINPSNGTAGTTVSFSGSNFPTGAQVLDITFGGDNITLAQQITTSPQGSFSGSFTVPASAGGQAILPGSYLVRVTVAPNTRADVNFNVYGSDDTFTISLSPNFLQGEPGGQPVTSGILKALGGAAPTVKMAVKGLPPGVTTGWNGVNQPVYTLSAPPGGQNYFDLTLVLPGMIPMGQYPAGLEGWVDTNDNNVWDEGEKTTRVNLELSIMPPQGYGMGMLTLTPNYGRVGDTITFAGSGFPAGTAVQSLTFAQTNVLSNAITTSSDGSFSGVFTVPANAFGMPTGPGKYPVDVIVGTPPDDRRGGFDFQVVSSNQKFSVGASPGWLARPAGETASVSISVRSLVSTPPSPNVILRIEGLPMGVTSSFTSANVTPPVGGMESRELRLNISSGTPMGNYRVSVRAYNAANPSEEMWADFTLEITPSSGFMDMGMAMITLSSPFGSVGQQVTVSGYGFPKSQSLTSIRLGPTGVTPSVATTTDAEGAFSAVITTPQLPSGPHPLEVNVAGTIRMIPFQVMGANDTFSIKVSPNWLEPIPAGDANGRQIAITVTALPGKTPSVTLSTEGLFAAFGTITQTWNPTSRTVNVTSAGGAATATLVLKPSGDIPPGPYPFNIVAVEGGTRRDYHMELPVGPPAGFMGGLMGMDQGAWNTQWQGTEFEHGVFFPEVMLSPRSGPAGTQVSYTGTSLPAGANITGIRFGGQSLPLPPTGLVADSSGGFSGSFIVNEAWNLMPGMYGVEFSASKSDGGSQYIVEDFNLMRSDAVFSLEATPDWIPPIPPGGYGQTRVNVRALGYNSVNVTLAVQEMLDGWGIPGGAQAHWNATDGPATANATVPAAGTASKDFYLQGTNPGRYMITIVGWVDGNGNRVLDRNIPAEADSAFMMPLDFDVEPPPEFKNWDMNTMINDMGMSSQDKYLFYFPEITLNPNMGQAGTRVSIQATDYPANAAVTRLRFAGMELPVPAGTAADANGGFTLVLNVPQTMWNAATAPGWYDIEVEAQKTSEPPVHILKPFQVIAADQAFTLRADPDWLPPIPPGGSATTLIRVRSLGSAANVTLSVDKIPPGINTAFSSTSVNVTPGGSGSATLTLTPAQVPPGHYFAEIKGTATINGNVRTFFAHLEFDVQPPLGFMNWDRNALMNQMGMQATDKYLFYFPEITLNPNMGQAGTKVAISATDYPGGANVTHLRFAGMELPVPAGTAADGNGGFTLVFNVPKTIWGGNTGSGWYDVEVEAQKPGEPPAFIMKPFQVTAGDVAFAMRAEPDWLPPIPPAGSTTTIRINSLGAGANVTLSVDKIPPGMNTAFSTSLVNVPPGGSGSAVLTLTPTGIPPGHYGAEVKGTATVGGSPKTFYTHIEFDVQPPLGFMDWDRNAIMNQMGMQAADKYLFYFPEITLNPNIGQAGSKVTIKATDFPDGANVTRLRFANTDLPVPSGTAADANGDFNLVFNVPKTIWGGASITSGWYDVEVEAQKPGEPPVFIMKPFQVTAADVAFTLKAEPDWLPPIPPAGATTTIMVKSMGAAANVTLSVDRIPPGIGTALSTSLVNVPPGGSGSATLTLTPTSIQQGHYGAEVKGTATVGGNQKTFYAHIEFDVQPPLEFMNTSWMAQQGVWFPEITINPNAGPVKTKVSVKATDFPAGAEITHLRFAGRELPVPANTLANDDGDVTLVFNVPGDFGLGRYMVEVEATKTGMPPVFIAKPFFIEDSGVSFRLNVVPGFIPGVAQGQSGNTTVFVESNGPSVTVNLNVDGLPPGVTANFSSSSLTVPPGGSLSTRLTIATRASTPPGHYPLTVRGVSGAEVRVTPFGFGVIPPAAFQVPEFTLEPDFAPAAYYDKQYKVTFSGTGFPASQSVTGLTFGSQTLAIPDNLTTDASGNFNGVFQMPTGLTPGTYDVRVAVADGSGGYIYDSRPFAVRGADARFILNTSPPYLPPVLQGGQGVTMVNVRSVGTTAANVTLSVDGLAPGITAAFTPSSIFAVSPGGSGSATLTLTVGAGTPPGPYPLNIRGSSGSQTVVIPLGFGVMPDIGGGAGHATVTINPAQARPGEHIGISGAGFTGGRTITLTAAPPGAPVPIDITPGAIQVQNDGTWATEITVPGAGQVPPGTYIIKASDGTMASKNRFSIVPATSADFFLNISPPFKEIVRGASGNATLTLSSKNGFQNNVSFSVGHLAPGVTATFKNAAGTTVSQFAGAPAGIREIVAPVALTPVPGEDLIITVLIDVDAATPIGPYDIGLKAGSGTVFRSIPLGLMVVSPGASLSISPMSGPADTDIRLSGSGFTAGETLAIKFAGSAITTVPAAVTAAQDGTFTATITAPATTAGIYPVSVTGAASGTSIDRPYSLKPSAVNSFVLYASPSKVDIPRGGANTITAKIEPLGSFQAAVTLSVSGLSAVSGATANFTPSATITPSIGTPTTATLTINIPAGATAGRYPLTITGTSGAITQTRKVTLNVVPPAGTADFGISLAPNTVTVSPNASGNTTVTVTAVNGFTGTATLTAGMLDPLAAWPAGITATTGDVTPSATTGLGKKTVLFTVAAGTLPGSWAIKITGTSGALSHSTDVMVVVTPSGTTITPYASPRLDPTTVTASTPMGMEPPWGDKITINGIINDGAEASIITPSKVDVPPETLANLPEGAADILGRVTNVESSAPVDGVEWDLGFPYDPAVLAAAGMSEENLKIAYLNPNTGAWTEVTTTVDTTNKIAYASPDHFSSWTLLATPAPPPSQVVTEYPAGGGGGGGASGVTSLHEFITGSGRFVIDTTAESDDHRVELNIPKDTVAKNKVGQPFYTITIREQAAPAAAPAGSRILGLVYDIGPGGATFDPPVNLVFNYADSWIPSGVAEEGLVIATWQDGGWVELDNGTVDTAANTITAPVSHFTVFTILAHTAAASFEMASLDVSPATVNPGETVTVRATAANTGDIAGSHEVTLKVGDEVIAVEQIDLAGGASRTLTFTLAAPDAGSYTIDVNGLTATLTVIESPEAPAEEAVVAEEPTAPEEAMPAAPGAAPAPEETPAAPPETLPATPQIPGVAAVPPTETAPVSRMNDLFIFLGVVAAGAVIIGVVYWRTRLVRKKS